MFSEFRQKIAPVKLIAVSKTVEGARLEAALADGQRVFGENYVQEAAAKWPGLRARYPDIELHCIGHLQSNKALEAVKLFDCIDTLDRESLAQALARAMDKAGRRVPLLVEVNIGAEPQKSGCLPEQVSALLATARALKLDVQGLMAIPPADADPTPYFQRLAAMNRELGLARLSMGMSADYAAAIAAGATEVRVGSILFGKRG